MLARQRERRRCYRRVCIFRIDLLYHTNINVSTAVPAAISMLGIHRPGSHMPDRMFYGEYKHGRLWGASRFAILPSHLRMLTKNAVIRQRTVQSELFMNSLLCHINASARCVSCTGLFLAVAAMSTRSSSEDGLQARETGTANITLPNNLHVKRGTSCNTKASHR